jgi:hypothetical protein
MELQASLPSGGGLQLFPATLLKILKVVVIDQQFLQRSYMAPTAKVLRR